MSALPIPATLALNPDEAGVWSMLLARRASWCLVSGSLLTVRWPVARCSWPRWREVQPSMHERHDALAFDLGPPSWPILFPGVRIVRAIRDSAHRHDCKLEMPANRRFWRLDKPEMRHLG
jgi:hypothetical protein